MKKKDQETVNARIASSAEALITRIAASEETLNSRTAASQEALNIRTTAIEVALANYGEHLRLLNDAVAQLQIKTNEFTEKTAEIDSIHQKLKSNNFQTTTYDSLVNYQDYRNQIKSNYQTYSSSLTEYETLISGISHLDTIVTVPLSNLTSEKSEQKTIVSLRHDIDADPEKGVELASILAHYGVPASFYILHSAQYYGIYSDSKFHRNPRLKTWVKELLLSGVEIGLHNDAVGLSKKGYNGAEILVRELNFIRSLEAKVIGTVAHNSFPTQLAENFEIFEELVLYDRENELDLGALSLAKLELEYEGNYSLSKDQIIEDDLNEFLKLDYAQDRIVWLSAYLLHNPLMGKEYEIDVWLLGEDQWLICDRRKDHKHHDIVEGSKNLLKYLGDLKGGPRVVLTIHPEFYQSK